MLIASNMLCLCWLPASLPHITTHCAAHTSTHSLPLTYTRTHTPTLVYHMHTLPCTLTHTHNGQWTDAVPNPLFFSLKHMLTHPLTSSLIPRPHSQLFNVARQTHIIMGSLHSSQISHLLLYPSLWLLVPGLSSHFHYCFLYNHFFKVNAGQQYLWKMATRFWTLRKPLIICIYPLPTHTHAHTHTIIYTHTLFNIAEHPRRCSLWSWSRSDHHLPPDSHRCHLLLPSLRFIRQEIGVAVL